MLWFLWLRTLEDDKIRTNLVSLLEIHVGYHHNRQCSPRW